MRLNKRACRKLADPTWKMNLNSGLFCADQLQYIVRSAVRNVDHQRVLILYVYDREQVNVGETRPLWTVFQSREQYITCLLYTSFGPQRCGTHRQLYSYLYPGGSHKRSLYKGGSGSGIGRSTDKCRIWAAVFRYLWR